MSAPLRRLIQKLRRLGVTIDKTPRGIRLTPRSKVPPADLARLMEARDEVRALIDDDDRAADATPVSAYRSLGLERFRGTWTHPLGDEHAARIVSGAIPIDEARRAETLRRRRMSRLGRGSTNWRYPS